MDLTILGGSELAVVSRSTPATVTTVAVLGSTTVRVPPGSHVALSGFTLLGGRQVEVAPGDGPQVAIRAYTLLGGIKVVETPS